MSNILKIFKRDFKNLFTNSMAIILAVGIAVIPSLYAWFNIFANWDPYGSTGNMQVAVVIEDEGYKFRDIEIDVGSQIEANLKANDAIDWQFVSKDVATRGIKSGKYYAGIEIPAGFSKSLTSIVSNKFQQPQITYYANEKKNAIATKITDKVVQTVQQEVNESFVTTVINVVSSLIDLVADASKNGALDSINDLQSKISSASSTITNVQKTVDSFDKIMKSTKSLNDSLNDKDLKEVIDKTNKLLDSGVDMTILLKDSINGITSSVDTTLGMASSGINEAADIISSITNKTVDDVDVPVSEAKARLLTLKAQLEAIKDSLETVKSFIPGNTRIIDSTVARLNERISKLDTVISKLDKIKNNTAKSDVAAIVKEIKSVSSGVADIQKSYKNNIQPVVNANLTSLIDLLRVTGNLVTDLNGDLPTLKSISGNVNSTIESGEDLVKLIDGLLTNVKKQLDNLNKKIDGLGDSEIVNTILNLSGTNSEQLGAFLACPVIVNTDKVYGIENYGSAMAPFYSTLAIWVGAMILIAVVKTNVKRKKEIGENVRIYQTYFGRMITFLLFSVAQSVIICAGDLYFLKIQCYHPMKFMLAGIVAAVAFSVFVYSLAFTFGDIGKSIGIIFLVIQIGGSGGTFPIDVTPNFFQVLNPYMPFTFVIEAMRECVCGTYANDYWIDLLKLITYIGVGLVIGTGVKFLVKKPIKFFEKQVEKTGLF